jgi:VanZ family protein
VKKISLSFVRFKGILVRVSPSRLTWAVPLRRCQGTKQMEEPAPRSKIWLVALIMAVFIVYGSLYPFDFRIPPGGAGPIAVFLASWNARPGRGDFLANILLYSPFGFFCLLGPRRIGSARTFFLAVLAGGLLSLCMELTQYYDFGRDTEATDFYANTLGTFLGALAGLVAGRAFHVPLTGGVAVRPVLLISAWVSYRLYPYVPTIDLHKYWNALKPVVLTPSLTAYDLFRQTAIWLTLCALIDAAVRGRRPVRLVGLFAIGVLCAKVLMIAADVRVAELAGFAVAFVLWLGSRSCPPRVRAGFAGIVLCGYVAASRLEPFQFDSTARPFGWIPFQSFMFGSLAVDTLSFLEKFFLYGSMLYLLNHASGGRQLTTAVAVAALLLATSWMEMFLPNRSAEITDALMVLVIALIFALLPAEPGAEANRPAPRD